MDEAGAAVWGWICAGAWIFRGAVTTEAGRGEQKQGKEVILGLPICSSPAPRGRLNPFPHRVPLHLHARAGGTAFSGTERHGPNRSASISKIRVSSGQLRRARQSSARSTRVVVLLISKGRYLYALQGDSTVLTTLSAKTLPTPCRLRALGPPRWSACRQ